ncbi:MAG: hypothetical protein ACOX3A_06790 [bacterium]
MGGFTGLPNHYFVHNLHRLKGRFFIIGVYPNFRAREEEQREPILGYAWWKQKYMFRMQVIN